MARGEDKNFYERLDFQMGVAFVLVAAALLWYSNQLTDKCALNAVDTLGTQSELPKWVAVLYCAVVDWKVAIIGIVGVFLAWSGLKKITGSF